MTAVTTGPAPAPIIGRRYEMAELASALDVARAGQGRLFLLSGDAGIGKTRLAGALADASEPLGVPVRWGWCSEGGGEKPFWPWIQVLRAELAGLQPGELPASAAHLARLVPELAARGGPAPPPPPSDPAGPRSALFEAVTAFLVERSVRGGMVIVLEDLHAADDASLKLLQYVARDVASSHLLVVGTYRDPEVRSSPVLHRLMSELVRHGRRMVVPGLHEDAVAALLERVTGSATPVELARLVHHTTDGNPFFVEEVGRLLVSERQLDLGRVSFPPDLPAVILRRLDPHAAELGEALSAASVLGRRIDGALLASVLGSSVGATLDLLGEAQRLGVVEDAGGQFRFAQAGLRDVLYDRLRPSERVALHRRSGEALLATGSAAQLAHHFYCAARGGDGREAVRWCTAAGEEATAALAFEEAATQYGRALEALALSPPVDERRRYECLMALAGAQQSAGELPLARQTYERALKTARTLGSPELLARAAIGVAFDTPATAVEEALAALSPGDSPERARLLVLLARDRGADRAAAFGREGVEIARRLGEPQTLRAVLSGWHRILDGSPDALEERLVVAGELVELATAAGDGPGLVLARQWRASDLFVLGDIAATDAELEDAAREAAALGTPAVVWGVAVAEAGLALLRGQLDEAERHGRRALAAGERAGLPAAGSVFAIQLVELHRHRGEWDRIDTAICTPAMRGIAAAYRDAAGDARRVLAEGPSTKWDAANLAELAWVLEATERARDLYDGLAPVAGRHVVIAHASVSLGSADRYLGQLATLLGRYDDAESHFQAAHRLHARLGSPLWDAYTFADHARMLLRRSHHGDRELATELAAAGSRGFRSLGMTFHERRVDALFGPAVAVPVPATPPIATPDRARLSQEGEYWAFEYGGEAARLRDSKGLRYLAALLRAPGREHHALDLVAGGSPGAKSQEPELVGAGGGDAGPVLDAKAKAAYWARLAGLREDLDEATASNDLGRAERAQDEIDFLMAELAGAVGLGGRDRRAASDSERARQSVTRAIKGAVERLAEAHPALGDHLRSTVRTGVFSMYAPDPRAPITWDG